MDTLEIQRYTLELPAVDLVLFKSLVKKFGWKAKKSTATSYAATVSPSADEWWNVPENVAMVNEGCAQLRQGKGVVLTSEELRARLGLEIHHLLFSNCLGTS